MKIGEVLEKTGLTDRAVRLYIEHGLITPSVEKTTADEKALHFLRKMWKNSAKFQYFEKPISPYRRSGV